MSYRHSLSLVVGTALLYTLWEVLAHRFLMALPMETWHRVSAGVGALLALTITWVSVRTIQRQQRQLQELSRLKEDLAQMVVHDLRTPLTAMIGSLETVRSGIVGDVSADAREMMTIAIEGSRSLLRMVNDLLDIAKLEAGETILEVSTVDVPALVEEAVQSVVPLADDRGLRLITVIEPGIPTVRLDAEKVRRVIVNLLGNAIKFTPSGGRVELRAHWEAMQRRLTLSVSDTGEGIPPEDRHRIFDKFGQVTTRKAGRKMSTGLGLTFCKLIAEAHGGSIDVVSEVGKGSTFVVVLPAREQRP